MLGFCKLPDWRSSAFHHFESSEIETKVTIQGAKQEKNTRFRASQFTYFDNIYRKNLCVIKMYIQRSQTTDSLHKIIYATKKDYATYVTLILLILASLLAIENFKN